MLFSGCQDVAWLSTCNESHWYDKVIQFHVFIILAYPGEEGWMLAFAPEHGQLLKAKEAKAPTAKVTKNFTISTCWKNSGISENPTWTNHPTKLTTPQETLQVDLWALCDFWSSFRRKKRSMAAIPWIYCGFLVFFFNENLRGVINAEMVVHVYPKVISLRDLFTWNSIAPPWVNISRSNSGKWKVCETIYIYTCRPILF